MNEVEVLEITRGHIIVRYNDKKCTILGEGLLLVAGNNISYVIYSNSIKKWDAPFSNINIHENEKKEILSYLLKEFEKKGQRIDIE